MFNHLSINVHIVSAITTLPMSLLIFAVLLGGHCVRSLNSTDDGRELAERDNSMIAVPLPRTCKDVKAGRDRIAVTLSNGIRVLCDTKTDGGGWIVFQRRVSSKFHFYKNWAQYKNGFGDFMDSFWLGNENLYRLTLERGHKLRVEFTFRGHSFYEEYDWFRVFGEAQKYKLNVGGYRRTLAGDSLAYHNGMPFSTYDRDNDQSLRSCAKRRKGGWWYKNCSNCNFNGWWGSKAYGLGLTWETLTGPRNSVTFTEMKIKPIG